MSLESPTPEQSNWVLSSSEQMERRIERAIAEEDDLQVHDGASLLTAVQRRELRENSRRKSVELKKERNEAKKQERQAKKDRKKEEKLQRTTERDSQRSTKGSSRLSFQKRGSKIDDDDVQHLIDEEVIQGRDEDHGEFDNLMEPTGQDVVDAPVETRPESVGSTLFSQFHVSVDDLSHTVWASCENLEAEAGPQTDGPPESPYVSSEDEATEQRSRTGSSSQPDNLEVDDDDDDD
eukprot:scpid97391/ scgid1324/ 